MRVCENGSFKIKNPGKLDPKSLKNLKTGDQIGTTITSFKMLVIKRNRFNRRGANKLFEAKG